MFVGFQQSVVRAAPVIPAAMDARPLAPSTCVDVPKVIAELDKGKIIKLIHADLIYMLNRYQKFCIGASVFANVLYALAN